MVRIGLAPLALIALTGCIPAAPPAESAGPVTYCPVLANRDWHAWIDRMPGPGAQPTLNISGEVDMPTPGYTLTLKPGPADRMMPPGLRFTLEATPPNGIVTQVVTPTAISYRAPTPYSEVREIFIACGEQTLVRIPDVMMTD